MKKVDPNVGGWGVAGLTGGLSSDFSGGALPRVNRGAEAPGGDQRMMSAYSPQPWQVRKV